MGLSWTTYPLFCKNVFILFFILCCLTGCNESKAPEKPASPVKDQQNKEITEKTVFHVPLLNNPATLDPIYIQDEYGASIVHQIFDGLVKFDSYLSILPDLAETWKIDAEGKVYRFSIRKDATFHNGKPVTIEDVLFSLSRLIRATPAPAILPHLLKIKGAQNYRDESTDSIEGLQQTGQNEFTITLSEAHSPFITALGMVYAKIIPKAEVIKYQDSFGQNPVGSGAFQFLSWEPDKLIRLRQYPEHFSGPPFLDEIHYKIYPGVEVDQMLSDFREGKLDEMPAYGQFKQELASVKDLQWFNRPSLSLLFYGFRCDHPALKDPEVRVALAKAVDRKKLVNDVYNRQFEPATKVLPPGMPRNGHETGNAENSTTSSQNNRNQSLEEKLHNLPALEIVSASQSSFAQHELGFITKTWAELGVTVNIKYITDWSDFENYIKSDAVQIYRYAWFADMPDPDSFFYPLFESGSPVNFMKFRNKTVDQLLLAARGERDAIKRTSLYSEIESIVMQTAPMLPLFYLNVNRVYQPDVQGAAPSALGAHTMPLQHIRLTGRQ